ncbi:MAG: hypothetical protein AABW54_02695 [Candidatus Micrarchaeota archaeon]
MGIFRRVGGRLHVFSVNHVTREDNLPSERATRDVSELFKALKRRGLCRTQSEVRARGLSRVGLEFAELGSSGAASHSLSSRYFKALQLRGKRNGVEFVPLEDRRLVALGLLEAGVTEMLAQAIHLRAAGREPMLAPRASAEALKLILRDIAEFHEIDLSNPQLVDFRHALDQLAMATREIDRSRFPNVGYFLATLTNAVSTRRSLLMHERAQELGLSHAVMGAVHGAQLQALSKARAEYVNISRPDRLETTGLAKRMLPQFYLLREDLAKLEAVIPRG